MSSHQVIEPIKKNKNEKRNSCLSPWTLEQTLDEQIPESTELKIIFPYDFNTGIFSLNNYKTCPHYCGIDYQYVVDTIQK